MSRWKWLLIGIAVVLVGIIAWRLWAPARARGRRARRGRQ